MATTTQAAPARRRSEPTPWLKPGIFIGGLVPLISIAIRWSQGTLGANPITQAQNELGLAALVFLMATLACTPGRVLFRWNWAIRIRRELGLFAFFYACIHMTNYVALDQIFSLETIVEDIAQRPFITVGFLALVLLVPVALTSTTGWVVRLGYKRWQRLHQLVYIAAILAVVHFIWRVKIDVSQPMTYAVILAALFAVRIYFWLKKRYEW